MQIKFCPSFPTYVFRYAGRLYADLNATPNFSFIRSLSLKCSSNIQLAKLLSKTEVALWLLGPNPYKLMLSNIHAPLKIADEQYAYSTSVDSKRIHHTLANIRAGNIYLFIYYYE